jgi:hypothetical protein
VYAYDNFIRYLKTDQYIDKSLDICRDEVIWCQKHWALYIPSWKIIRKFEQIMQIPKLDINFTCNWP